MEREEYMRLALVFAQEAAADGEVPVGCVIVKDGTVVGRGRNTRERDRDALMHAEIAAISDACRTLRAWRLTGCVLYVTLEPCPMCAGAIMNACISEVCYGASDTEWGACGGVLNLFEEAFPQRPRLYGGILAEESRQLLRTFFQSLRKK